MRVRRPRGSVKAGSALGYGMADESARCVHNAWFHHRADVAGCLRRDLLFDRSQRCNRCGRRHATVARRMATGLCDMRGVTQEFFPWVDDGEVDCAEIWRNDTSPRHCGKPVVATDGYRACEFDAPEASLSLRLRLDQELVPILASEPARFLATTGPGLAGCCIAIFRGDRSARLADNF